MARKQPEGLWRLQAFDPEAPEGLPESAASAFATAAQQLGSDDVFSGGALVVEAAALSELTGFNPAVGDTIPPSSVKRSAEAAGSDRVKALANRQPHLRAHYAALGVFLRVCAAHRLAIIPGAHSVRKR